MLFESKKRKTDFAMQRAELSAIGSLMIFGLVHARVSPVLPLLTGLVRVALVEKRKLAVLNVRHVQAVTTAGMNDLAALGVAPFLVVVARAEMHLDPGARCQSANHAQIFAPHLVNTTPREDLIGRTATLAIKDAQIDDAFLVFAKRVQTERRIYVSNLSMSKDVFI